MLLGVSSDLPLTCESDSMTDVTIHLRDNGPLFVEGPVKIVDADGHAFEIAGR